MLLFLKRPYPLNKDPHLAKRQSLLVSLFIFLFLFIVQPFGDHQMEWQVALMICFGYGVITLFSALFMTTLLPSILPKVFKENSWVVWKELTQFLVLLLLIASLNMVYSYYMNQYFCFINATIFNVLFKTFYLTITLGIIPITIIVLYNQNRLLKQYYTEAQNINQRIEQHSEIELEDNLLKIEGEGKKEVYSFTPEDIFYIKSSSNYSEIYFSEGDKLSKTIVRSSLTNLEKQLSSLKQFQRVHRGYIANLNLVSKVEGNAQGFRLFYNQSNYFVPVSRNKTELVKALL